jgi:RHS repeat-associated protein
MHPNSDPTFHFFGNWQLGHEGHVTNAWHETHADVSIGGSDGTTALFYRREPDFHINARDERELQRTLLAYGVPHRTLGDTGWAFEDGQHLLRTRKGDFAVATLVHEAQSLVDAARTRVHVFHPIGGTAERYTSEYFYRDVLGLDDEREVGFPLVRDLMVDSLGHAVHFRPGDSGPPYRMWNLLDDSGRIIRLEMEAAARYLDGDRPGGRVKTHLVSRLVDPESDDHGTTHYEYDSDLLSAVVYPSLNGERRYSYSYNVDGLLTQISDPYGHKLNIAYAPDLEDADDRLLPRVKVTCIWDEEGNSLTYDYHHIEGMVAVELANQAGSESVVRYRYVVETSDSGQRSVVSQETVVMRGQPSPQFVRVSTEFSRDGALNPVSVTDGNGSTSYQEHNDFNQVTALVDPLGHKRQFKYDLSSAPSPAQPHRYDLLAIQEDISDSGGATTPVEIQYEYARYDVSSSPFPGDYALSTHRTAKLTSELGKSWNYYYDDGSQGRPTAPTLIEDPLGQTASFEFDNTGARSAGVDASGAKSSFLYTRVGGLSSVTDPNGNVRRWIYDAATDWLLGETDAAGSFAGDPAHSILLIRDLNGAVVRETDAVGDIVEYDYLRNGRLRRVTQFGDGPLFTRFAYDCRGNVEEIHFPSGEVNRFFYDEAGRLYRRGRASSSSQIFVYDAGGRLREFVDESGKTTRYEYDEAGRNIEIHEPDYRVGSNLVSGKVVKLAYDERGHRRAVSDSQLPGPILLTYDRSGLLESQTDCWGHRLHYTYDARGDLTRVYGDTGAVDLQYERDVVGRVIKVADAAFNDPGVDFIYRYRQGPRVHNLYGVEVPAIGLRSRFEYDSNDRVTKVSHYANGVSVAEYGYDRRADGRVAAFTGDRVGALDYDGRKQLIYEGDLDLVSMYDADGNRLSRGANGATAVQIFDEQNHLLQAPTINARFSYDEDGNLVTRRDAGSSAVRTYQFDGTGRLVRVEDVAFSIDYAYDLDGNLLERRLTEGGLTTVRRFRRSGGAILEETNEAGNSIAVYTVDPGGRVLRLRTDRVVPNSAGGNSLYVQADGLGSIVGLCDASGAVRSRLSYDSWGNASLSDPDDLAGCFRFLSAFEDETTGLMHFGSRWYSPEIGRWMSEDPLLAVLGPRGGHRLPEAHEELSNLYRYVENDPVNEADPFGLGKAKIVIRVLRWVRGGGGRGRLARAGGTLGEGQAVRSVREGGSVVVKGGSSEARQQVARQIAERASPEGRAVHQSTPHGPGQSPHYHPAVGGGQGLGHVLYGLTGYLTVEQYLGNNPVSDVLDFFNPLSLPRDVGDVVSAVDDAMSSTDVQWEHVAL